MGKDAETSSLGERNDEMAVDLPEAHRKKLLRKIDLHVLPILFLIYFAAFLDRVNISNALTLGLPADLHLTGQQPNIALTVFFVPYILFEVPSNVLLRKLTPHVWLAICISVFGAAMIGQGFVKSYSGLIATRFFLGLAESGIFPGSFYLISFWYTRQEAQQRFTFYWCSVIIAGAFGGLLASAISQMHGVGGLASWRWIFILEGIATMLIGFLSFFLVSDFPSQAKWISEEERNYLAARAKENEETGEGITFKAVLHFFKDIRNILGAIQYFAIVVPIYSLSYFLPTIVKTLHYSTVQTQLHSVPPFAAGLGYCIIIAWLSDRVQLRLPFILFSEALLIIGLALLLAFPKDRFHVEYGALCLVLMGSLGAGASIVCWYLMNLQGHVQRSLGSGWMIAFGNSGGIVATFTFLSRDAPYYHTGYTICMTVAAAGTVSTIWYGWLIHRQRLRVRAEGDLSKSVMMSY